MNRLTALANAPYVVNLFEQPAALSDTARGLVEPTRLATLASMARRRKFRRVVLTGMGSSFHSLHELHLVLIAARIDAVMIETSELVHYMTNWCASSSLIVAVSQSGKSAEIVRLLGINRGRAPIIAVTNEGSSPLAAAADALLLTYAGSEVSVSCKTYVASLAALHCLGAIFRGRSVAASRRIIRTTAQATAAYLNGWQAHVDQLESTLLHKRQLSLVGRGISLSAVGTGALIIKEADRFPAEGMSSAAFRHGPLEMVGPHTLTFVFRGCARTEKLNLRLLESIRQAGGEAVMIGAGSALKSCAIERRSDVVSSVLEILPIQMVTLALATLSGREPGQFHHATKVTATE